jgi:hypothetical protein
MVKMAAGRPEAFVDIATDVEVVSITHPSDPRLDELYDTLIQPYFPDPNDRDELDDLKAMLSANCKATNSRVQYYIVAATRRSLPIATTIFSFHDCGDFCFMKAEYTAVVIHERRQHTATYLCTLRERMVHEAALLRGYSGVDCSIILVVNPARVAPGSLANPVPHIPLWRSLGYRPVLFPFVQLPLAPGKCATTHLSLWIKTKGARFQQRAFLTKYEMLSIVHGCNYLEYPATSDWHDPHLASMLAHLHQCPITPILV